MWIYQAITSYLKGLTRGNGLGDGDISSESNKEAEYAAAEEEDKCMAEEAAGEGLKPNEGESAVNVELDLDDEAA